MRVLDNSSENNEVPEFLSDFIESSMFPEQTVNYDFGVYYLPEERHRKAHILSDESPDGTVTLKRYIVDYAIPDTKFISIFHITENKDKL